MSVVRSLLPFILFAVLAPLTSQLVGAVAALALGVVLLAVARQRGVSRDQLTIDLSSLTFFAVYTVICLISPHSDDGRWVGAAIQLWLGITVIITLVIGRPFTEPIARTQAPQQLWTTPEFRRFNKVITGAWAVSFLVSAALVALLVALHRAPTPVVIGIMVLAIVVPVLFTRARSKTLQAAAGERRPDAVAQPPGDL